MCVIYLSGVVIIPFTAAVLFKAALALQKQSIWIRGIGKIRGEINKIEAEK